MNIFERVRLTLSSPNPDKSAGQPTHLSTVTEKVSPADTIHKTATDAVVATMQKARLVSSQLDQVLQKG